MIQLPTLASSRASAAELIAAAPRDHSPVVSLEGVQSLTQSFVDELCKQLIALRIDRVTFVAPQERFMAHFMRAHMLRSAKFTVETRA